MSLSSKNRDIDLTAGPLIMGVVNVTPDSFSDGGEYYSVDAAVARGLRLAADGADILDVGGESTRPGAPAVPDSEELRRIVPVICELKAQRPELIISADTRKAAVAAAAIEAGADIINDVSGLAYSPELAQVAAAAGVGLILMHMRGTPENMQSASHLDYQDIINEVKIFLLSAVERALDYGVKRESIILDPGIGFAKTPEQNLALLGNLEVLRETGYPVLVGHSRKSFIGAALGRQEPKERLAGSLGVAVFLALKQADIIRVHDVCETRDAITMFKLCMEAGENR